MNKFMSQKLYKKKTLLEVNTFRHFAEKAMGSEQEINELPVKELNRVLSKFFIPPPKRSGDGDKYEPDFLTGFQTSIQWWLTEQKF